MGNSKFIAEHVSHMHPDKTCDQISDYLLDIYLKEDKNARVAIETGGGHGNIALFGEITSKIKVNHEKTVRDFYRNLAGKDISVRSYITAQSPEIAMGVDVGGAGDQGIMVGYATRENEEYIPQEVYLARKLLKGFEVDAKSQVTIENKKITSIVLSVQGKSREELVSHVYKCGIKVEENRIYANNTGAFETGGFDADSGVTGRKIVIDAYGPRVPVGGGAFSGKDPTKVDRSAAYMARWVSLQLLKKYSAEEVLVKIGYVIGGIEPLIKFAVVDGHETEFGYDCRPAAIIERFDLRRPIYLDTAKNGHFGRIGKLPWEEM